MTRGETPSVLELVRAELDLVDAIAKRVARIIGNAVDREDLVSAGREGLLDAASRFDAARGASFRTYAGLRIFGAIVDSVRQTAGLPRRTYERLAAMRADGLVSEGRLEPFPVPFGPCDDADLEAAVRDRAAAFVVAATLGAELANEHHAEGDGHAEDVSGGAYRVSDPEEALMRAELLALIRDGIDGLPPDERLVLRKVYYENRSLADVARQLDCGKPWVTRLHARAMQRLSQRLKPRT
jgi:RNA polymerase sigma factor for flagellar operon FliA